MTSNKIYKYILSSTVNYEKGYKQIGYKVYESDTDKSEFMKTTNYPFILLDILDNHVLVKSSKGFTTKKLFEVDLNYIYESDNQSLHDMFTSKNTDVNKIGKEIVRQELKKLKNDGKI